MSEPSKPFDPVAQFAEMQSLWTAWMNPFRFAVPNLSRYEAIDPRVQEIAIVAAMHNMASMLRDPGRIKEVLSEELAERAKKLGAS